MKTVELTWHTPDGIPIYARNWQPADQPRAVICLLHGMGEHIGRYEDMAKALTGEGFAVIAADLRGHGRSGGRRGHIPSAEAVLNDIRQLLEQANSRYNNLPVFLYGHSLGGILALFYVLKRKPEIRGVISSSPGLHSSLVEQPAKVAAAKVLGALFPTLTLPSGLDPYTLTRNENLVLDYINDPLVHHKVTLGFGRIMVQINKWTLKHAGDFSLPLLLMHGKSDKLTYASGSIEFSKRASDISKLVLWDNALHELHNEPEKEEVYTAVFKWINQLQEDRKYGIAAKSQ